MSTVELIIKVAIGENYNPDKTVIPCPGWILMKNKLKLICFCRRRNQILVYIIWCNNTAKRENASTVRLPDFRSSCMKLNKSPRTTQSY